MQPAEVEDSLPAVEEALVPSVIVVARLGISLERALTPVALELEATLEEEEEEEALEHQAKLATPAVASDTCPATVSKAPSATTALEWGTLVGTARIPKSARATPVDPKDTSPATVLVKSLLPRNVILVVACFLFL